MDRCESRFKAVSPQLCSQLRAAGLYESTDPR